jgi:hypothetical protein
MAFYAAKNARVKLGAVNIYAMRWTINAKTDDLDVSNCEGGGFGTYIPGLIDADVTFDGIWDSVQDPFANPPNISPGAFFGNGLTGANATCKFYLDYVNLASFWSFSSLLITSVSQDTDVRGFLKFSCTSKGCGAYTMPV